MPIPDVTEPVGRALEGRWLLDHPFYRRWERGEVSMTELAHYAGQYRHFERVLPGFLGSVAEGLPEGQTRRFVAATLADEMGDPVPHAERFESFAAAVGAGEEAPTPATAALLDTYEALLDESPGAALAGFVAYELQSADIAASKADGLRRHYHLDDGGVAFWDHHALVDVTHGSWAREALAASDGPTPDEKALRRTADAWWSFLDERDALAGAPTG
ncbi:MAG: iron-containing redox enzyme family protein [Acidobacteriota bacterium]|nr:iron-containing redox enzyme family protein [Acidobacteriota bacterium]